MLSRLVFVKELGLGVAFAVLVDATIVRAILVPALMKFLGSAAWWSPSSTPSSTPPGTYETLPTTSLVSQGALSTELSRESVPSLQHTINPSYERN